MELLSNGTVMAQGPGVSSNWYALTPKRRRQRRHEAVPVLAREHETQRLGHGDERPRRRPGLRLGGEYSGRGVRQNFTHTARSTTRSPTSGRTSPTSRRASSATTRRMLPNGNILVGYLSGPQTYTFSPTSNTWTQAATKLNSDRSDEGAGSSCRTTASSLNHIFSTGHAQCYIPSTNQWGPDRQRPRVADQSGGRLRTRPVVPAARWAGLRCRRTRHRLLHSVEQHLVRRARHPQRPRRR